MQLFLSFDFSEIGSWNIERNFLIPKKSNFPGFWIRLTRDCRISIEFLQGFHGRKIGSTGSYRKSSAFSEHRAAESSETKYKPAAIENLRKDLLQQRRKGKLSGTQQLALRYSKTSAFLSYMQKNRELMDRNASRKNRNSETLRIVKN